EIIARRPLYQAVIEQAINAAFRDPRFPSVTPGELKRLDIEISVLTPPVPVKNWRDIVLGRDGVILRRGARSAVYLPQVATEQGWTLEQMLDNLSLKAGLDEKAWREDDTTFAVFQAEVFGEKEDEPRP
ncbi:MAG: AmmeMemoRadiSam system protein A, partial [Victivallales bacterium]|nr:AmmeMemoRadiSam system protein A [Victivallales bacterium]